MVLCTHRLGWLVIHHKHLVTTWLKIKYYKNLLPMMFFLFWSLVFPFQHTHLLHNETTIKHWTFLNIHFSHMMEWWSQTQWSKNHEPTLWSLNNMGGVGGYLPLKFTGTIQRIIAAKVPAVSHSKDPLKSILTGAKLNIAISLYNWGSSDMCVIFAPCITTDFCLSFFCSILWFGWTRLEL